MASQVAKPYSLASVPRGLASQAATTLLEISQDPADAVPGSIGRRPCQVLRSLSLGGLLGCDEAAAFGDLPVDIIVRSLTG